MNFDVETKTDCGIVRCHVDLSQAVAPELFQVLNRLIRQAATNPSFSIVLDLQDKAQVDPGFLRELGQVGERLRRGRRALFLYRVPEVVRRHLETEGLSQSLPRLENPEAAPPPDSQAGSALENEATLFQALKEGVQQTCQAICPGLGVKAGQPFLKGPMLETDPAIAARLEVSGKGFDGTIVLSFPQTTYLAILGEMHGEKYETLGAALQDGASEILNMVRSLARKGARGYLISKEIPETTSGSAAPKLLSAADCVVVIPFESGAGRFFLELGMSYRRAAA